MTMPEAQTTHTIQFRPAQINNSPQDHFSQPHRPQNHNIQNHLYSSAILHHCAQKCTCSDDRWDDPDRAADVPLASGAKQAELLQSTHFSVSGQDGQFECSWGCRFLFDTPTALGFRGEKHQSTWRYSHRRSKSRNGREPLLLRSCPDTVVPLLFRNIALVHKIVEDRQECQKLLGRCLRTAESRV